ncbi:MAG TPA: winged helix DNA-binding domain-containing protein [Ktedonobacterales bacterium]|jgi:hypothetical protein
MNTKALPLTWEQVCAWRLSQQHLTQRVTSERLLEAASALIGIQAQVLSSAELALWARVQDMPQGAVSDALWNQRSLIKTWAMRGALHLFTAAEFPLIAATLRTRQPITGAWLKYFQLNTDEPKVIIEGIRAALDGRCLTREHLAAEAARVTGLTHLEKALRSGWGELLKPAAYQGYLCFGPSQNQHVTFVRPDQWLSKWEEYETGKALIILVRRYLATYGPATYSDFAHWWGLRSAPKVRAAFQRLEAELTEVSIEGRPAWALAATIKQIREVPPPPAARLLPGFDAYTIGVLPHIEYLLPGPLKAKISRTSGWISPVLLVAGRVAGVWRHEKRGQRVAVQIEPFQALDAATKTSIQEEAERLGAFLGAPVEVAYS